MKKGLAISGGGNKIGWLYGKAYNLMVKNKNDYNVITGISSGALLTPFLCLGLFDKIHHILLKEKRIWKIKPFSLFGFIYAFFCGKSFGKMRLKEIYKKYYTPDKHKKLLESNKDAIIGVYNMTKGQYETFNITNIENYKKVINIIIASASPTLITDPVKINDNYYCDGGLAKHCEVDYIIDKNYKLDAIFSRPETKNVKVKKLKLKNIFSVLINTPLYYVSEKDELKVRNYGGNLYFPKEELTDVFYDFKINQKELINKGKND